MAGPILSALTRGYTSKQVIQFLLRKFPQHANKINNAVAMGYGPDKILKFLSGGRKGLAEDEQQGAQTEHEQTLGIDQQRRSNVNKTAAIAGGAAATGLGALALSRAVPQLAQQIAPGLLGGGVTPPQPPQPPAPPSAPTPMGPGPNSPGVQVLPNAQPPSNSATNVPNQAQSATPTQQPTQEEVFNRLNKKIDELPDVAKQNDELWDKVQKGDVRLDGKKDDFLFAAKGIRSKGGLKTKEEFDRFKQIYDQAPKEFRGPAMTNYLLNQVKQGELGKSLVKPNEETASKESPIDSSKEMPQEKREIAALPNGDIGEIESVSKGIAKINVNGEIKHRKLSDLIKEPEEVRLALNDILQIPESERSSAMDLLHYTPKHKLLHIQFPNGKIAWYEDIDESIVNSILEAKGTPKTSGKTASGEEWAAGIPDSRFSVVSERIIRDPKYSKANEGKTWGYSEKTYDKFKSLRTKPKEKSGPKSKVPKKKTGST